jgi:hypothetical protein
MTTALVTIQLSSSSWKKSLSGCILVVPVGHVGTFSVSLVPDVKVRHALSHRPCKVTNRWPTSPRLAHGQVWTQYTELKGLHRVASTRRLAAQSALAVLLTRVRRRRTTTSSSFGFSARGVDLCQGHGVDSYGMIHRYALFTILTLFFDARSWH